MWYYRDITRKIEDSVAHFPALVLTGPRQAGKTELLKRIFPRHNYVSLDIPSRAEQAEKDPELFLRNHPPPLLVDEVQYAPKLFRHLKTLIDADRHHMGQFVLTGSQKFVLMKAVADSLAGRCAVLELETLSFEEIKAMEPGRQDLLMTYIHRGGFPELWRNQNAPVSIYYDSYVATYLERDVRQILNVVSLRDFERFVRACAARNGQLLDKQALARDVGISVKASNDWLSVLQASNQIVLLEPWFSNFGKRIVKSPKLYFCDTGLLCHFLEVSPDLLLKTPFLGGIWECFVFAEIRKTIALGKDPQSYWFYRDSQGREVDFIVSKGGFSKLIECKWTETPDRRDCKSLEELITIVQKKVDPHFSQTQGAVVCRTPDRFPITTNSIALPSSELRKFLSDS